MNGRLCVRASQTHTCTHTTDGGLEMIEPESESDDADDAGDADNAGGVDLGPVSEPSQIVKVFDSLLAERKVTFKSKAQYFELWGQARAQVEAARPSKRLRHLATPTPIATSPTSSASPTSEIYAIPTRALELVSGQ